MRALTLARDSHVNDRFSHRPLFNSAVFLLALPWTGRLGGATKGQVLGQVPRLARGVMDSAFFSLTASSNVGWCFFWDLGLDLELPVSGEWDYPTLEMLGLILHGRDVRRREYIIPLRVQIMASWLELSGFNLAAVSIS